MPDGSFAQPQQRHFDPYTSNGGTILAIAGADFSVIAGDTRQSEGYSIQTRYAPKVFRLYVFRDLFPTRGLMCASQNRSRRPRRKWLRGRRKHVRQEGQATARGGSRVALVTHRAAAHDPSQWYRHAHAKDMPLRAIARLIQTMLYAQRFFPYYVYNILGGIEEDGTLISPVSPIPKHMLIALVSLQAAEPSTRLTPWDHTSGRHVVPRVQPSH